MRVAMLSEGWPGLPSGFAMADAWAGVSTVHLDLSECPAPDPRAALALGEPATRLDSGVVTVERGDQTWLAAPDRLWDPVQLSQALDELASRGPGKIVIPVGDVEPSGDPRLMWEGHVAAIPSRWRALDIDVLVASDRPLLGFGGLGAALMDRDPSDAGRLAAQAAQSAWAEFASIADAAADYAPLLGPRRVSELPCTGAAGGLAYCLAIGGARLLGASEAFARAAGFDRDAQGADLVVAVVPVLDHAGLDSGAASVAASWAARRGVPAVVLTSEARVGRRDLMAAMIASAHEARPGVEGFTEGLRRLAQTWLRPQEEPQVRPRAVDRA